MRFLLTGKLSSAVFEVTFEQRGLPPLRPSRENSSSSSCCDKYCQVCN